MHSGEHYYQPENGQRVPSAVEALHQSAAAAGPAAHESSQAVSTAPIETCITTAWETLHVPTKGRSKSTEPTLSYSAPDLRLSNEEADGEAGLLDASGSSAHTRSHDGNEHDESDADTPTKVRKRGRGNPRATKGGRKNTVTASLPGSAILRYSALAPASAQNSNDSQQASDVPSLDSPETV
jgi:hypothetical protein